MGGIQYPRLNSLARDIWQWCEEKEIWVVASYIPSQENTDADRESRRTNIDTEWELVNFAFNKIENRWGHPEIDLFASRNNAKISKFCSWQRDPEAWTIDAFTLDWKNFKFYAFPPFSMILKALQKIRNDGACGILVVPNWPSQPWYPVFMAMLMDKPEIFSPSPDLLLSPCRSVIHPLASHLSLVAGKVCG